MTQRSIVLDAPRWVHYGQIYVLSPGCDPVLPAEAFAGQSNGLCGAGVEGGLFLATGLHTGYVHMQVEVHADEPPVDERWEEIVEASCAFSQTPVVLEDWGGENRCELPLAEGTYRVRYCAKRFGEAPEGNGEDGEELVERYALIFWPAPARPDQVIKQTSPGAAYWNGGAWVKKN
jgi:hypothetical protein